MKSHQNKPTFISLALGTDSIMYDYITLISFTLIAIISPGADFALVSSLSYLNGRKAAFMSALGIATGILLHVAYSVFALYFIKDYTPQILNYMRFFGAAYLLYLGYATLTQTIMTSKTKIDALQLRHAFRTGFICNALNPKTMLLVFSLLSQLFQQHRSVVELFSFGIFVAAAHGIWFSVVAAFFSNPQISQYLFKKQRNMNRIIGTIFIVLALMLLIS